MGFATSLQSFNLPSQKDPSSMLAASLEPNMAPSPSATESSSEEYSNTKVTRHRVPFMRANHSRGRKSSALSRPRVSRVPSQLLLVPATVSTQIKSTPHKALRIVQREPGKHPECLFISGRMADVCAALERMALAEQAAQQA